VKPHTKSSKVIELGSISNLDTAPDAATLYLSAKVGLPVLYVCVCACVCVKYTCTITHAQTHVHAHTLPDAKCPKKLVKKNQHTTGREISINLPFVRHELDFLFFFFWGSQQAPSLSLAHSLSLSLPPSFLLSLSFSLYTLPHTAQT
jgi:hypothetical protein